MPGFTFVVLGMAGGIWLTVPPVSAFVPANAFISSAGCTAPLTNSGAVQNSAVSRCCRARCAPPLGPPTWLQSTFTLPVCWRAGSRRASSIQAESSGDGTQLADAYAEVADSSGRVTLEGLLQWGEVAELLEEGSLTEEEVRDLFVKATQATGGGDWMDQGAFQRFNQELDALFEDDDEPEQAPQAPEATTRSAGGDRAAKAKGADLQAALRAAQARQERLTRAFRSLVGPGPMVLDDLEGWADVQELLADDELSRQELRSLWAAVPKLPGADAVDLDGFLAFNMELDKLFEDDEDEPPAASAPAPQVEETVLKVTADQLTPSDVDLSSQEPTAGGGAEARALLMELLEDHQGNCGITCDPAARAEIMQAVQALVQKGGDTNLVKQGADAVLQAMVGSWQLLYTSSNSMEYNQGLTGLANTLPGASFQGVKQTFEAGVDDYIFDCLIEEYLTVTQGKPLVVTIKGDWEIKASKSLITGESSTAINVSPKTMNYGFINVKAWAWKPLRAMNLLDVVYMDRDLRVMRGQTATKSVFIFQKC